MTTPLTPGQQELFDWAAAGMPDWYSDSETPNEHLALSAVIMDRAKQQSSDWLERQTFIGTADGPTSTTPDFIGQHARDRGTRRRAGEDTETLRLRLRNIPDAITRPALLAAITEILVQAGITTAPTMLEFPRDVSYPGLEVAPTGTGGTFASLGTGDWAFTPDTGFQGRMPFRSVFPAQAFRLDFTGAGSGGNNGNFATTGVVFDGARFHNPSGVAGHDAAVSWTLRVCDADGNVVSGRQRVYAGRGYRCGGVSPMIIVMLPFGTTESTRQVVIEILRLKKGAGVRLAVERRAIP